jgi:hypothetical protein
MTMNQLNIFKRKEVFLEVQENGYVQLLLSAEIFVSAPNHQCDDQWSNVNNFYHVCYGLFRQNVPADMTVTGLAFTTAGIDLDNNAQRLLKSALAALAEARAKAIDSAIIHNIIQAGYAERAAKDLVQLTRQATTAALSEDRGMGKTPSIWNPSRLK